MTVLNVAKNDFSEIELAAIPFNTLADHYGANLAREQLALEHEAYELGEQRFLKMLERQVKAGEFSDNVTAQPLVLTLHPKLTARFTEWVQSVINTAGPSPRAFFMLHHGVTPDDAQGMTKEELSKHSGVRAEASALITLKVVLSTLTDATKASIQAVSVQLGKAIEDETRFGRIRVQEAAYFQKNVAKQLDKRVGHVYKKAFMQVIEADMLSKGLLGGDVWSGWKTADYMLTGIKMLELLIESTGLVEMTKQRLPNGDIDVTSTQMVQLAPEFVKVLSQRAGALAGISPMYQPCVVPPKPWSEVSGGGYWSNGRRPLALVRTHTKRGLRRYEEVSMPAVYKAVNIAQNTPWRINKKVLAVANEVVNWKNCPVDDVPRLEREDLPERPLDMDTNEVSRKLWRRAAAAVYRRDKARQSRRLSMEFMLQQANKFSNHKAIWFPMNLDWRGRVYAVPMFNPQGNDMTKGLLSLAKGKPIGLDGFYWLKIHGANCAGVDKVPFPERIKFIEDNEGAILASAENPIENTWWAEQDSPFCFLAFCFEYAGVKNHGLNYNCSLPLAFDGSCSGIQHFSAMLRDSVGGRAVNLLPSDEVQDIYRIVADRVNETLREHAVGGSKTSVEQVTDKTTGEIREKVTLGDSVLAAQWLEFGVTRKVTKRSVMTLAYGSKEFGFRQQVLEDTIQPAIDAGHGMMFTMPNQAAGYMAKLIWNAVTVTVVAAVEAMNWLKSAAKLLAAEVKDKKTKEVLRKRCAIHWVTPDGFPVWQEYRKRDQARLKLVFLGKANVMVTYNTGKDTEIDAYKQESGIAPNFVHSQDGNHLRMTVVHAHDAYGIDSFALIHDSFGTIPADAGNLFKAVRETMVSTYEDNDVIADFYDQFADQLHESQLDKMPPVPCKGTLELREILDSEFAFA